MPISSSHRRKLTYQDYVRIPEDRKRHEILDGVHVMTLTPYLRHQRLIVQMICEISKLIQCQGLGELLAAPIDVLLSKHDIVQPDLLFVAAERAAILRVENIQGAPDLVIEILSPGTRRRDLGTKRERYEKLGIGEYWILDPERDAATVFRRSGPEAMGFEPPILLSAEAGDRLTSPLLPGLEIEMGRLFAR